MRKIDVINNIFSAFALTFLFMMIALQISPVLDTVNLTLIGFFIICACMVFRDALED